MNKKSSIGNLDANMAALIAYAALAVFLLIPALRYVAWLVPLVIYLLEKDSRFVRFHAMQGLVWGVAVAVVIGVLALLSLIPLIIFSVILRIIYWVVIVVGVAVSALLAIQAYNGNEYELPFVGPFARGFMGKF